MQQKAVSDFDINVIAFGGWINGIGLIEEIVTTFVNAKYENKNKDIIKTINDLIVNENYQDDILKKKFCFEKKENITISAKYK
ncbi:hypothetical protein [Spiroplasma sp. AdecLV25b]|uniref:hypothetical protein n=1 Tax=Spiroplasma sp. AdecLV25b TaxID=3027162 RepID=UPI0027E0C8DD|nr:hypothetical protein [Spiroplasma sp. AdecLV25b]